jgi:signal transduction histidine kinase
VRARANGNSGLGLAIGKAIVDAHGGSIAVTSETGKGATFAVRLPAAPR